jgi:hypothetical protein
MVLLHRGADTGPTTPGMALQVIATRVHLDQSSSPSCCIIGREQWREHTTMPLLTYSVSICFNPNEVANFTSHHWLRCSSSVSRYNACSYSFRLQISLRTITNLYVFLHSCN